VDGQYGASAALPAAQEFGQRPEHVLEDRLAKQVGEETLGVDKEQLL